MTGRQDDHMRPEGLIRQPRFWPIVLGAIGVIALWFVLPEKFGIKFDHVIFGYTAFVIVLYTMETAAMREEMVRQAELQLRPVIVGTSKQGLLELVNVGHGAAVNIEIRPAILKDPTLGKKVGIRINSPHIMQVGVPERLYTWEPFSIETQKPIARDLFSGCLVPKDAQFPTEIRIEYDRVDRRHRYYSVIEIGPQYVRLLDHGRV